MERSHGIMHQPKKKEDRKTPGVRDAPVGDNSVM
jgi:hypothetical protein